MPIIYTKNGIRDISDEGVEQVTPLESLERARESQNKAMARISEFVAFLDIEIEKCQNSNIES